MCLALACGLACSRHENPQAIFDHAYQAFVHGNLQQSQDESRIANQRFKDRDPEWAWKFRILEAESLLWRGMYDDVLSLIQSALPPSEHNLQVEILSVKAVALSSLHRFSEAQEALTEATALCKIAMEIKCGDVSRSEGILAVQQNRIDAAHEYFEESLRFARTHKDAFLELTALINLGLTSQQLQHYDEAIDWTDSAYEASMKMGAEGEAENALGNLGWAYYNLGDFEKSLDLSLEAEKRARATGNVVLELYWTTNVGYVYANSAELTRAKQSYLRALDLSGKTHGTEDIYNTLRALALVSVEAGELDDAKKYSDQAFDLARKDNNRLSELYPLLVEGMIAAKSNQPADAERIFREVENDPVVNVSLKWRAEHALARLYEDESRADAADREYRAALATFEAARSSLQRNDSRLPFSNNAFHIYDDYIHFLVTRGNTDEALRWAAYDRGRTLDEGLGLLSFELPTKKSTFGPPPLDAHAIARRAEGTIFFYWLGDKQSYLWAITPQKTNLFTLPAGAQINAAVERYRRALGGPQDVLASNDADGRWLWTTLVAPAQSLLNKGGKVFIVPDGNLNNLNFETLLVSDSAGTQPHFWIEDATIADASSLRIFASGRRNQGPEKSQQKRTLLLIGNSVSPSSKYPEMPKAGLQMETVARHFASASVDTFARDKATPASYLDTAPENFSYIHFVAHGMANRLSPLDSAIVLSQPRQSSDAVNNESFKLHARDIMPHPLHADLVTISSCYGAGDRWYSGEGLVGLSWAFLHAGAHNVVAALWEASDASTLQLMDKFYDELNKGQTPDAALRNAKLALLRDSPYRNPFYWGPFQLYTGS